MSETAFTDDSSGLAAFSRRAGNGTHVVNIGGQSFPCNIGPLDTPTPVPGTIADALSRIEEGFADLLSTLPAIRAGLRDIAELDGAAAVYGELFVDRLLQLCGSTERCGLNPKTTPAPKPTVDHAERRLRTIQRTQQRLKTLC